ncbi:MAG: preprotein translocase subunit SecG [Opitutaceae bacterium]
MTLLLGIFTFILVIVSIFMVLVILAQRAKSDGGVGAALGGGVTEAAFGAESGNVLSRGTTIAAVIFFVLSFGLYLGHLYQHRHSTGATTDGLPDMPELTAPAASGETIPGEVNTTETPDQPAVSLPSVETPSAEETPSTQTPGETDVEETEPEATAPEETAPTP